MALIGYMRVSTNEQKLDIQKNALKEYGCSVIFKDVMSGAKSESPGLSEMLKYLRNGEDTVVVWKLDRIGRSLSDLVTLIENFAERNIKFKSLNDPIDTSSPQGRMIFGIFATLADFERELIRERTCAGLNSARMRGVQLGRPKGLSKVAQQKAIIAEQLYKEGTLTTKEICDEVNISSRTLYRYLRFRGVEF